MTSKSFPTMLLTQNQHSRTEKIDKLIIQNLNLAMLTKLNYINLKHL